MEFMINATHEDGRVKASFTLNEKEYDLGYICPQSNNCIRYVDFLDNLRNLYPLWDEYGGFIYCNDDFTKEWSFMSDTENLLISFCESENFDNVYSVKIPLTNEVFTQMEKLVITTHGKYSKSYTSTDKLVDNFPYDYVYGLGIVSEIPPHAVSYRNYLMKLNKHIKVS